MPLMLLPTITRRRFLQTSVAAGAVTTVSLLGRAGAAQEQPESVHWAFLSDLHVPQDTANEYRGFKPYENMQKAVPQVVETKPEGVIVTGDLARLEGFAEDYAQLKALLQPLTETVPVGLALGNHDDRTNFLAAFSERAGEAQAVAGKHVTVIDTPPVRFVLLDSLLYTNRVAGLLGKDQRAWLARFLGRGDDKPTLLFFHHALRDTDGDLLDADKLFSIIEPYPQVKALVYGHSHEYKLETREGLHLINLPSTAYNFKDEEPVGWVSAKLTAQGGEFTLRAFAGNTANDGQTTKLVWRG